jgi:hypothetical protein
VEKQQTAEERINEAETPAEIEQIVTDFTADLNGGESA